MKRGKKRGVIIPADLKVSNTLYVLFIHFKMCTLIYKIWHHRSKKKTRMIIAGEA